MLVTNAEKKLNIAEIYGNRLMFKYLNPSNHLVLLTPWPVVDLGESKYKQRVKIRSDTTEQNA